ncbi:MAG: calcium-binding protein, partial [Marinovum sp.]|nr:calcium-binding protein [Marinovum sp.]
DYLEGSFGWDVLIGNDGADTLNGGIGNDRLTGGAKADVFQFALGDGTDTLVDYQDGTDQIEILSGAATFGDLSFSDSGSNAIITFGNVSIIVQGTSSSVFDAGDFIF